VTARVEEAFTAPVGESAVTVVVARVERPVTFNVPFEVSDDVAVIAPPVNVLIVEVTAFKSVEKSDVDVALPSDALVL
jgi:hypothetical protein